MEYRQFRKLVEEGEKAHVDFKIRCDAFMDSKVGSRAELAKDICAMANNGYIASYLIIGVSDDGQHFRPVDNKKLTDDYLQDFCKKAIFPPPKVRIHRENWSRALPSHRDKDFVIIQVGPNRRQAFRLALDFIDYSQEVCHRRNEVWIRRNATSDLATPEEIARLVNGKSPYVDAAAEEMQRHRDVFSRLSQGEQRALINEEAITILEGLSYAGLPKEDWLRRTTLGGGATLFTTLWKKSDSTAILLCVLPCRDTLPKRALEDLHRFVYGTSGMGLYDTGFVVWSALPMAVTALGRRRIRAVRRVCLLPVIGSVPGSRVAQALPGSRKAGPIQHYYRRQLHPPLLHKQGETFLPSSSELLIVDRIKSLPEYRETLAQVVKQVESTALTLIKPE